MSESACKPRDRKMSINFSRALGIHEQAIQVRSERAGVLANNLANADTPNFKARDIDFEGILRGEALSLSAKGTMKTTHANHMSMHPTLTDYQQLYRTPQQPSIDGNTVEEQVEHAAYMENTLAFQSSFTLLNSKFKGLVTALRGE